MIQDKQAGEEGEEGEEGDEGEEGGDRPSQIGREHEGNTGATRWGIEG
jgi:hypothetical protein